MLGEKPIPKSRDDASAFPTCCRIEMKGQIRQIQDHPVGICERINLCRQALADCQLERGRLTVIDEPYRRRLHALRGKGGDRTRQEYQSQNQRRQMP